MADAKALPKAGCWLVVAWLVAGALVARAETGGFHVGVAAAADLQRFTYDKSVYLPAAPDDVTNNADTDDGTLWTLGLFAGYRWPLGASGLHMDAEVDVAAHPKRLEGDLPGTGYTWTDTWPEDWWLERDRSYGITVRLGGTFAGGPWGWHVLAGLRRVETEFSVTETGCPGPDLLCPPTPLANFTEEVERSFNARSLGVGLERSLGERLALQFDVRYTDYKRKSWDRLFDGGVVIIPTELDGRETSAMLRLIWRP